MVWATSRFSIRLSTAPVSANFSKSKTRCRVEHIFGFIEGAMNGSFVRSIGIVRAKAATALTCLVYNIFRYVQINKYQPQLFASMG